MTNKKGGSVLENVINAFLTRYPKLTTRNRYPNPHPTPNLHPSNQHDMPLSPIADTPSLPDAHAAETPVSPGVTDILLCLPALAPENLQPTLDAIGEAFPTEAVLIASPDAAPADRTNWLAYPTARANVGWVLAGADYAAAARLAAEYSPKVTLLLGNESAALDPQHLRALADRVRTRNIDLAVPRLHLGPADGLVNAAILYPLTRALFASDIHFPLPLDAALSPRMAARLAAPALHLFAVGQGDSLIWPVSEAAIAAFSVREVDAGPSALPPPPVGDFNALFTRVTGLLFADIDAKANFWQRARAPLTLSGLAQAPPTSPIPTQSDTLADAAEMIESFHLAYANLQEIWSLVLPPQSRLALKKLSLAAPDAFLMDPALWARIVYDFALAFHLRTLNRGHLLGAMTPLYLAWAAGHLISSGDDPDRANRAIDNTAAAFDNEKPYIVSRWRWPDRFNP
jgi:hypothetical protein